MEKEEIICECEHERFSHGWAKNSEEDFTGKCSIYDCDCKKFKPKNKSPSGHN